MSIINESQKHELDRLMQQRIDDGKATGAQFYVSCEGKVVYNSNVGHADSSAKRQLNGDSIFRLFSMSKPITAVAVMILIERGILSFDTPVEDILPGFKNQHIINDDGTLTPVKTITTIRHLMNMTAGLYYPDANTVGGRAAYAFEEKFMRGIANGHQLSTIELANLIGTVPIGFEPGTHWNYGTCADVLGGVVAAASGMPFSEFLEKEIFTPLGMKDTGFYVPADKLDRYTAMFDRDSSGRLFPREVNLFGVIDRSAKPGFESGGAGLVSTVDDYIKFADMLAFGGTKDGIQIINPNTFKLLVTPHFDNKLKSDLTWDSLQGYTYTNLLRILESPAAVGYNGTVGEFGWDGWTGNFVSIDSKRKIVCLFMVQICGGGDPDFMYALRKVIYG